MTRLEAFEQAQNTGQIAISKNTAKAFAALVELERVFYDDMLDALTDKYRPQDYDEIAEPYTKAFSDLCSQLQRGIMEHCIYQNGLSMLEFKGI